MKYQLAIQLSEKEYSDLDLIIDLEDELEDSLPEDDIDGHDIGTGEINIYIHTNSPTKTLQTALTLLEQKRFDLKKIKVGYRDFNDEYYTPMWPDNLEKFNVS